MEPRLDCAVHSNTVEGRGSVTESRSNKSSGPHPDRARRAGVLETTR